MIRLIATDLDWTFFIPRQGVPDSAWQAIDQARQAGVRLAVCTGRPYGGYGLEWGLQMEPEGVHAFANGSLITKGKSIVHHTPLAWSTHQAMVQAARHLGLAFYLTGASGRLYAENPPPHLERFAELMGVGYQRADLLNLDEASVGGALVVSGPVWQQIRGELRALEGLDWLEYPTDEDTVVAVADPAGISKASALRWMAQHYRIDLSEVCMIGDSQNDFQAIKEAGLGLAVGNAEEAIKAVADGVVADVREGGFAQAVEWALGAKK